MPAGQPALEDKVWYHDAEVAVAAPLADSGEGSLNERRSRLNSRERVRHGEPGVVVRVYADLQGGEALTHLRGYLVYSVRKHTAVRVAEGDAVRSGAACRLYCLHRVLGVVVVAVIEVLRVKDDLIKTGLQVFYRRADEFKILVPGRSEHLLGVEQVRFSEDDRDRRARREKTRERPVIPRKDYSYDNRYFMQVNFRRDAFDTSKLSKKARWGNFPSVSAGWAISNEKFFKDNISRDAISFLKLRGSWGQNGNVNILSDYRYASTIALNQSFYQYNPSLGDGKLTLGSKPSGLANPDLKWETSEQVDLGLDARFLNDRLTLGLDWYRKTTKDLLIEITPIPEIGVNKRVVNTGKVLNSGLDFELGWRDHIKDFKYSVTVNGSTLKNEVKEVSNLVSRLTEVGIDGFNNQLKPTFEAGHQVWYFRGYKYAGVAEDGSALYYNKNGETTSAPTDEDKQDLGSGIPKFTYGITLNAEYKGFDLTVFGTGSAGNKIYNLMVSADRPLINGIDTYWKNSWRADRTNAKYPDMKKVATDWKFFSSDAAVFSGSYFKIKQIQLGYTLPKAISSVAGISNLRVYCSLDDFFTITKYPGADPETASMNSGASRGFDNGTYPTSKKVVFGINVTF